MFREINIEDAQEVAEKGIGKKLMSKLENYAVDNNISFIRLNSALKREEAHKFYEHIGYTCDKVQKRFIKLFE